MFARIFLFLSFISVAVVTIGWFSTIPLAIVRVSVHADVHEAGLRAAAWHAANGPSRCPTRPDGPEQDQNSQEILLRDQRTGSTFCPPRLRNHHVQSEKPSAPPTVSADFGSTLGPIGQRE
jgi:hypothetical protein